MKRHEIVTRRGRSEHKNMTDGEEEMIGNASRAGRTGRRAVRQKIVVVIGESRHWSGDPAPSIFCLPFGFTLPFRRANLDRND